MGLWPYDSVSYRQQPSTVWLSAGLRVVRTRTPSEGWALLLAEPSFHRPDVHRMKQNVKD